MFNHTKLIVLCDLNEIPYKYEASGATLGFMTNTIMFLCAITLFTARFYVMQIVESTKLNQSVNIFKSNPHVQSALCMQVSRSGLHSRRTRNY